ncbi:hypothetical protein BC938DRAFT_474349 [Jimgerdemannia flammicorona]|uniref:Uncharacterized protein n=1 Tax=Jimgerdemannia flammicorona TaxID=994334 RepID=A0A433Q2C1_9FUNG|nr:hypothetical protein BC938DRAFT_474349 [Jimgerdemannia flammicorona]
MNKNILVSMITKVLYLYLNSREADMIVENLLPSRYLLRSGDFHRRHFSYIRGLDDFFINATASSL